MPLQRSGRAARESAKHPAATGLVDEATQEEVEEAVEEAPEDTGGKNPNAVALGRLGGKKGGKARAEKLTPERRSEIAKKAAKARWKS